MDSIYEWIKKRDPNLRNIAATVVEGPDIGEKILLSGAETVWQSGSSKVLEEAKEKISGVSGNSMLLQNGQRIFCEVIGNPGTLVICGGGHVSLPVIRLGKMTGFYVKVLEDRQEFARAAKEAGADEVICQSFESAMAEIPGDRDTYFVIVTRGHRYDSICLKEAVHKTNAYVGMMGSKRRVGIVKEQLIHSGMEKTLLDQVHTPIGLSIGAETPEEIAVSIMAEIIQVKHTEKRTVSYEEKLLDKLTSATDRMKNKILATIISRRGSAPRETGTKMLVMEDETVIGTVGGGYAENCMIQEALAMLKDRGQPAKTVIVEMLSQEAEEAGMVCGGTIEVLLEKIEKDCFDKD